MFTTPALTTSMSQPPSLIQPLRPMSLGGMVTVASARHVLAQRAQEDRATAQAQATAPVMLGLAAHIHKNWELAKRAKLDVEQKMLKAVRAKRGEYDPEVLARIRRQGGSEIYMMLFSTKARQAKALLSDVLIGSGTEKPWTIRPTELPELDPAQAEAILKDVYDKVLQAEQLLQPLDDQTVRQLVRDAKCMAEHQLEAEARARCHAMEEKMEDQQDEGRFLQALDQFLDDLTTFKTAFLKGPVVRRRTRYRWLPSSSGQFELQTTEVLVPEWERVDPFHMYPAPWSTGVDDAWLFERHKMTRGSLEALRGVEGYSVEAINSVLGQFGTSGLHEWLMIDTQKPLAEGRLGVVPAFSADTIDALQFWGPVSGQMLLDWGMDPSRIADPSREYEAEVWQIGPYILKAALNTDPAKRRPYAATGYERVPGAFWHNSLFDLVEDNCAMCNAAARALANNMGIASGPQVWVNVDRMPVGADITQLYPWKIHQTTSDPMGSTAPPLGFFQPNSNASELMAVFERFSILADEVSGIPRYMTGTEGTPGAGRTASGLSMMINNASKTLKGVLANIDIHVLTELLERQYYYNMRYVDDPDLKGDVSVVARGALSMATKEAAQVRRNEFLAMTANPVDMQIVGLEGRAQVLREVVKGLDMDTDKVVPSESMVRVKAAVAARAQQMQQLQAPPQPGGGQQLMDGAPVTDTFQPVAA